MIIIDLMEALQRQMNFCIRERNYKCGIYVTTEKNKDIVMKVIKDMIPSSYREVEMRNNQHESSVRYPNGNSIKIVRPNSNVRGYRFNGVIIDSNIPQKCINEIILPCLIPLNSEDGTYSRDVNPRLREYNCNISREDVVKSETLNRLNYFLSSDFLRKRKRDIPKPVIRFKNYNHEWSAGICPNCNKIISYDFSVGNGEVGNRKCYCSKCGQLCDFEDVSQLS